MQYMESDELILLCYMCKLYAYFLLCILNYVLGLAILLVKCYHPAL